MGPSFFSSFVFQKLLSIPKGKNLILPYNCEIIFGDTIQFDSFQVDDIVKKSEYEFNKLIKNQS